ncbi:MAG: hypothetical protein ACTJFR_02660 [Canibacter sp.]
MKFEDKYVSVENRYSLGVELESETLYLSVPVTNGIVDYEEYFKLSDTEFESFSKNPDRALTFADECRKREHDERLIQKPGWNRGTAI